ncbi:MAG TPA: dephospho-CoA kinase [Bacteroidales bacterium]|jgi:dephospho-CoA kinase|nr:dephospho-CoA kinase [Bacteroidales bacterium]MCZ2418031.1 dephospho-CoA kinase [Burkholderiales bacterium]OQC56684.1 MAG: Dephospho-CoA kinase [Bacteroidetes bacterium ADurb.Bin013]MBV6456860.1 Dephospho-CoA kinase [Bacteroidales bacterium]NLZ08848.1 dephospho-CoA kinase [Bacteroidales bacterium]
MKTPIILGITGGIGSGKSYVTRIFSALGVPSYDSDARTKQLYREDPALRELLIGILGPDVFSNGEPDTRKIASIIFNNTDLLKQINRTVHPYVVRDFNKWAAACHAPYVIFESAILLEMDPPFRATRVLTVSADRELRLHRTAGRDNVRIQSVMARMDKQWTDEQREAKADFVVLSDDKQALLPRVLEVHQYMLNLTNNLNEN